MKKILLLIVFIMLSSSTSAMGALTATEKQTLKKYFITWYNLDTDANGTLLFNSLTEAQQEALYNKVKTDIKASLNAIITNIDARKTEQEGINNTIKSELDSR